MMASFDGRFFGFLKKHPTSPEKQMSMQFLLARESHNHAVSLMAHAWGTSAKTIHDLAKKNVANSDNLE